MTNVISNGLVVIMGGSHIKVWTCCYCGNSGMPVRSTGWCPSCSHEKCENCDTYKVKDKLGLPISIDFPDD